MSLTLDTYRLLGRSGLRVSPLGLGTGTFGAGPGWGADNDDARKLFDTYVERGGNFIDSATTYEGAEQLLGEFTRDNRESMVLATKYGMARRPGDPNSVGDHRKNLIASVETSLRNLNTDYIDLLYLHVWDFTTPVEEILRGMDDLVRQGKVLYVAICNTPAWQISRMQTLGDLRGWSPLVALQIEYNLIERTGERDLIPMARAMGLGVVPWSPLGGGVLTGKYSRTDLDAEVVASATSGSRKSLAAAFGSLSERGLAIADVVKEVAAQLNKTPSQVALAWILHNPDITAPLIGARTPAQLEDNLGALDVELDPAHLTRLNEVSAIEPGIPHKSLALNSTLVFAGMNIETR
ncbi:aldo/keto reductase [Nocardia sp. CDC159]|uniref:Aldo/keto reductase n=2 Tax=Nocardiaceae TaxID=85025 RepID=A0A9X2E1T0_9NOCA|nr:aldo/keto reductase [Nocardia pulmonis]MCM6784885.1 aldo/keto reductase [Nocardia sp. CDC159]